MGSRDCMTDGDDLGRRTIWRETDADGYTTSVRQACGVTCLIVTDEDEGDSIWIDPPEAIRMARAILRHYGEKP